MFDLYYLGENTTLKEVFPFAKQIQKKDEATPRTKMYWLVEPNIEILDFGVFDYRPENYDQGYEHVWKWDSKNYGGVRLLPSKDVNGVKEVNKVVCKKSFDILNTATPEDYFSLNKYATHVWCVDPEYKLTDSINWAPDNFEPTFIHSFHLKGQLEHKYPEKEGGVKLYPKDWQNAETKYHNFLDANVTYPILYVKDVNDMQQRDVFADDYVWLVDLEHKTNVKTFDWVPNPFEGDYIHNFRMPYQLTEKYPLEMGGINLVPVDWRNAATKIHPDCPIEDENYDVFFTNKPFDDETFDFYAKRSDTEWFWVVDREYDFNGKLLYVPAEHEQDYIHIFKWGLEHRYDPDVTEVWDSRVGGIYLVNKNYDVTKKKLHTEIVPIRYDIYFTSDLTDYQTFARKSRTDAFWLVDKEHVISEVFKWVPAYSEQKYINIFKLPNQLEHKYPRSITNVSDNRAGGIKLVPKNFDEQDLKYQGLLTDIEIVEYEKFSSEEEGRAKTKHDWFWVIDSDVSVLESFNFDIIPDTWDEGKTHVWQKLNPITKRQYDYGGVMLCPKVPQVKGRPKYMREPSCVQKEYPIYYLEASDYTKPLYEAYRRFESTTDVDMYWVVDAYTQVDPDFEFDYYPTQWDKTNVHVFANEDGEHTNIRLVPNGTFTDTEYTDKDIANNSYTNLKLINTVASLRPKWPVVYLESVEKTEFINAIKDIQEPFVWTVDSDVKVDEKLLKRGYMPKITDVTKVHAWQKVNPRTEQVHAYGGLRLWPTANDYNEIKTSELKLNRIKNLQYVREPGSVTKPFEVVFLSYYEHGAETAYNALCSKVDAKWIKNVDGIFEAHKAAANAVDSKMFWVVDADAVIAEDFDFSHIPDVYDEEVVHVWSSKNPINGLEYGYGGVKLFNTQQVREATSWGLDFTTGLSSRFKSMPQISCVTKFNTDAFSTWRSAFRECVKLTLSTDSESKDRLEAWLHPVPDAEFRHDAKQGAEEGRAYAESNRDNALALAKINDFEWLKEYYER